METTTAAATLPTNPHEAERAGKLLAWLQTNYDEVRQLPDGSFAARSRLLYTTALFLGLTAWGFERRFCFADRELSARRFAELQTEDDTPEGFIAQRPERP